MASMRAAIGLFILSTVTFAAAFVTRHLFLSDVRPVSWDYEPPQNGTLELAYLLLSIENMAAIVGLIALVLGSVLWFRRRRQAVRHLSLPGLGPAAGPKI